MDNRQLTFSHLLYLTAHHWRLAVNRRLKNLGLSQASWVAVASIARHQQPLSQSELAQELGVESPTIVPLIHRLVALGLVERITTPATNVSDCWWSPTKGRPSMNRSKRWLTICAKRS